MKSSTKENTRRRTSRLQVETLEDRAMPSTFGSVSVLATVPSKPSIASAVPSGTPSSPHLFGLPPLPNDLAFHRAGNLFVTDSFQATLLRGPAGGGAARIWVQDRRLDSPSFGPNGIRVSPD